MAIKRRFIAKFQQPAESQPTETKGISPLGMPRRRLLMEMPGQADGGLGAASESVDRWYAVDGLEQRHDSAWDDAHELVHEAGRSRNNEQLLLVEPDIEQVWYPEKPVRPAQFDMGAAQPKACVFQGPDPATPDGATTFAWHLGKKYSRLQEARQQVKEENSRKIRVAHLDTGFDPSHITCPANIDLTRQRNFVTEDGVPNSSGDARDPGNSGYLLNPGHGPATLALLSGNKVPASNNYPGWTEDFLGGAPFASVVPIRIANSVIHFWTSSVAEGIEYAISIKADVLSMSMGGLPSAAWADAVNKAYEAGMVIVCAAGNNYSGFPTREIVWPARFERVIAACGVMSDKRPYYNLPVRTMQGNYGPPGKMVTALSAFTPNTPWARLGCANLVDMNGAGTSSATPQIAATAALWLAQHGEQFQTRDWRRAEAVRQALFESASKPEAIGARHGLAGVTADDTSEMLGRGMLNALAALDKVPADLKRTARDSVDFALLRALPGFGAGPASVSDRLLELELAQLVARSRKLQELVAETYGGVSANNRILRQIAEVIVDQDIASNSLRSAVANRYTPGSVRIRSIEPDAGQQGTPNTQKRKTPLKGSELPRRSLRTLPAHRRLRVFALDPSFSNRLDTAFINEAVVRVPWESTGSIGSSLRPGPVGEYLEVVDVDPASGCAYDPVDLDDPSLLATDGLAPSEGNPQFHQQMAYAIAMTTIGHFERALGRSALWAARRIPYSNESSKYERIYVPRLRLYPHALRQENAYYSPEKIALLFGYYPATLGNAGSSLPGGTVFTCLSHDIVAHETTHALLDGLHRRYSERTNLDMPAFHEGFSDIVALFQHFTFPEILRFALTQRQGDLALSQILANIGQQFGDTTGRYGPLRSAIGRDGGKIKTLAEETGAHERGAILVAAVFDAFVAIYNRRVEKVLRVAGFEFGEADRANSTQKRSQQMPAELIDLLADEAAKTAGHVLRMCIRSLDYCPPVDLDFGDYLRALITCDADLVPDDPYGYRIAFLEAFRERGIFPKGIRTLSIESLKWREPSDQIDDLGSIISQLDLDWNRDQDRKLSYEKGRNNAVLLHRWLSEKWMRGELNGDDFETLGIDTTCVKDGRQGNQLAHAGNAGVANRKPIRFEVHSIRPARRVTPEGTLKTEVIAVITQTMPLFDPAPLPDAGGAPPAVSTNSGPLFRGGATLIINAEPGAEHIRYAVLKPLWNKDRLERTRAFMGSESQFGLSDTYGMTDTGEPFAMLHRCI